MPAVIEQAKNAAYTSVGINLLVTDALVGREISAPKQLAEQAAAARSQAAATLTDFRGRTEPLAAKVAERLPEQVADAMQTGRNAAWTFIGIDAPKPATATTAKKTTKKTTKKAAEKTNAEQAG